MSRLECIDIDVHIAATSIVHGVTLEVPAGSVVGLIGPNGSGKSTLLRSVYRLLQPASGAVTIDGRDVWSELSARESAKHMAVVAQEVPSEFDFTVYEVVQLGRLPFKRFAERDNAHDDQLIQAALAIVGMASFAGRVFQTLSGGEKQRVLLARALAQQPKVLILDEPTNHLDVRAQIELLDLVAGLGVTTLTALHDLNLASSLCHFLYVLRAGSVIAAGTPTDVLTPATVRDAFGLHADVLTHPATGRPLLALSPLPTKETHPS